MMKLTKPVLVGAMEVSKKSSGKSPVKKNGNLPPDPAKSSFEIGNLLSTANKVSTQALAKRSEISEPLTCVSISLASGTDGFDPVYLCHEVVILYCRKWFIG